MANKFIYNLEQKQKYLDEITSENTKQQITGYFLRLGKKEEEYGKDIANMSLNELRDTLLSVGALDYTYRNHLVSLVRNYVKWTVWHDFAKNSKAIETITPRSIENVKLEREKMIKDAEQMENILFHGMRYESGENREIIAKLIMRLLYAGLTIEELQDLKKESRRANNIVTTEAGDYCIDDAASVLWDMCKDLTFIERASRKNDGTAVKLNLEDSDFLFRPIASKKTNSSTSCSRAFFMETVIRVFQSYSSYMGQNINVSPQNINLSGLFYKMFELEKTGIAISEETVSQISREKYNNKLRTKYTDWRNIFGHTQKLIIKNS